MSVLPSRPGLFILLGAALCAPSMGCAVSHWSLSSDSGSRAPWLNMEFLPSRKKAAVNYQRSISQQHAPGREQPVVRTATEPVHKEKRLAHWLMPQTERAPLPLPRTDLGPDGQSVGLHEDADSHPDWWDF